MKTIDIPAFPDGGRTWRRKTRIRDLCDGALRVLSRIFGDVAAHSSQLSPEVGKGGLSQETIDLYTPLEQEHPLSKIIIDMAARTNIVVYGAGIKFSSSEVDILGRATQSSFRNACCVEFHGDHGRGCIILFDENPFDFMDEDEVRAIVGHELAHIQNEDIQRDVLRDALVENIEKGCQKNRVKFLAGSFLVATVSGFIPGGPLWPVLLPSMLATIFSFQSSIDGRGVTEALANFLSKTAHRQQEYMADLLGASGVSGQAMQRALPKIIPSWQGIDHPESMLEQFARLGFNLRALEFLVFVHPPLSRRLHTLMLAFGAAMEDGAGDAGFKVSTDRNLREPVP